MIFVVSAERVFAKKMNLCYTDKRVDERFGLTVNGQAV